MVQKWKKNMIVPLTCVNVTIWSYNDSLCCVDDINIICINKGYIWNPNYIFRWRRKSYLPIACIKF